MKNEEIERETIFFERSLGIYSVVITLLDVKKREGDRLQWEATRRLFLASCFLTDRRGRPCFTYFVVHRFTNLLRIEG